MEEHNVPFEFHQQNARIAKFVRVPSLNTNNPCIRWDKLKKDNFVNQFIDMLSSSRNSIKSTVVQHLLSTVGANYRKEFAETADNLGFHHCVEPMDTYKTT